ncbi:cytochrome P450 [Favolaschia claudopus]|uniref:Cytochrome P450 n=1 Tax=Favolaschia claudopus TaxID=2862362 RepID=A0AAV9Z8K4_9AGAR
MFSMAISLPSFLLLVALPVLALLFVCRAINLLFFHPLSSIPGPWYAAVSSLWITTHVLRLEQCKTIHALFQTYGPVVRIAPNKVVFCDSGATKSVYSTWKFDKSDYYKSLLTNDNDHAMTTLPHAQHSIRRKAYASHYTPSNLSKLQPEIGEVTGKMIDTLHRLPGHTSVDTLALFRHLGLDILVASSYGFKLGAIDKWAVEAQDQLTEAIGDFPKRGLLRSAVPKWAWNLVCEIPNARFRLLCDSDKIMAEFVCARLYEMRATMNAGKEPLPLVLPTIVAPSPSHFLSSFPTFSRASSRASSPSPSCASDDSGYCEDVEKSYMVSRLLNYRYPTGETMPEKDIISECMGHMVAGTDTTSISLSYFLWELTRRQDIVRKLREEIDAVMPDSAAIPDIKVLNRMEYLNAFIKEGLRLYGAVPSLLERVVPESSSKNFACADGFDLMGYALPPGTIVGTQAWSMHRDPAVFQSPETFLPERWLPSYGSSKEDGVSAEVVEREAARLARMTSQMMPFGVGSRICGGMNLAHLILRMVLVSVLRNFDVEAAPGTDEKSMDVRDSFVMFPAAMECKLIFHPRASA